ncbi:MAG: PorV/PorQ family protein [Elusimicrobia bacterium]|nr:PorV/PorQ family protein [Elusimicrobiota bacterium]
MKKILIFGLVLFFGSGVSYAWLSEDDAGTCGAQFLKIGVGAKPMGMGGAFSALSGASSLYWNPAGLAGSGRSFIAMHTKWFEDTSIEFAGVVLPGAKRTFGLSYTRLAISDFEERDADTADPIGEFDASDQSIALSCGRKLGAVDFGWTVKAIKSKIKDTNSNAVFAADVGMIRRGLSFMGKPMSGAIVLKDFGGKIKFTEAKDPLPSVVKLGAAVKASDQLNIAADLNLPRDNKANVNIGLEYRLPVAGIKFPIRIGYKTLNDFDTVSGFSAGFGIGLAGLSFDFAWVPYGDFSDTYRFSLTGKF